MKSRIIILVLVLLATAVPVARGQECQPDHILATSVADTIFVAHFNAQRNCCTELTVDFNLDGFVVDFYEGDAGDWCLCLCCFNIDYQADGFAAGHYTVRVWNEDGSELYGETEVDVDGNGENPALSLIARGDCMEPGALEEPAAVPVTWGRVRSQFR